MKTSLLLICTLVLFNGCKKDDAPTISTGKFESAANIKNDPVILYTKDKIITDTAFIRSFQERNLIFPIFDLAPGISTSSVRVTFDNRAADSVSLEFGTTTGSYKLIFNQVYYDNNTVVYIGRDSLRTAIADDGELSCSNVFARIRRHSPLTYCAPVGVFGVWICKVLYQLPLLMNGNDVSLPIMSYCFLNKTSVSSCILQETYIPGQFNEDAIKTIHKEDTLVVQTRTLVLERR